MSTAVLERPPETEVPTRKPRLSFVISEEMKEDLELLAARDHRTVSNYVLTLVAEAIEKAKREGILEDSDTNY